MATTRALLRTGLELRLDDVANTIWSDTELNSFIDGAIVALYPTFWRSYTDTTTPASDGPITPMPAGASNLYFVGIQRTGSTRVRKIRGWTEGQAEAHLPKTDITGLTLVWSWTKGWDAPATDVESIDLPAQAQEVVLLRAHISALEFLLTQRLQTQKFHALQVRAQVSEQDIVAALEALHASLRERTERQLELMPLPEIQNT
jgi:hypothetical protein